MADLTSSPRPSVSAALGSLRERGLVLRPRPGAWLLPGDPPAEMSGTTARLLAAQEPA